VDPEVEDLRRRRQLLAREGEDGDAARLGQIARPSESSGPGPLGPPKTREPREHAEFVNAVQKYALSTRLGIPIMFHEEALHGLAAPKGTHFPIPMALGATWDPGARRARDVGRREGGAGARLPAGAVAVLDLARDPRWGRTEETYGRTRTTSRSWASRRSAATRARACRSRRQGLRDRQALRGARPQRGRHQHRALELRRALPARGAIGPVRGAITQAKPYAVMPSYNEIDGVPAHQNKWLLDTLLRGEWGFDGIVTSDYFAIVQLKDRHLTAADAAEAARRSLLAGVDIELPDPDTFPTLVDQVKDGRIAQSAVDTAVARVLRAKFLAGLFENPYVDVEKVDAQTNTPEHRALALDAARKAIVLVKNEQGVLPLDRKRIRTLAVIGPNAKGVHLGGYSRDPGHGVDVLDGITKAAGSGVRVLHAEGVRLTEEPFGVTNWWRDKVTLADPAQDPARIRQAVLGREAGGRGRARHRHERGAVARGLGRRAPRRRDGPRPAGPQQELVDAIRATGKPVVALLLNGRPLSVTHVARRCRRSWRASTSDRRAGPRSARCCSAT
jgi:beta-glucosidase